MKTIVENEKDISERRKKKNINELEYSGYELQDIGDFEVGRMGERVALQNEADAGVDESVLKEEEKNEMIAICVCILAFLLFFVALCIVALNGECKVGLCKKLDTSSFVNTKYLLKVFDFEAPLRHAWVGMIVSLVGVSFFCMHLFMVWRQKGGSEQLKSWSAITRHETFEYMRREYKYMIVLMVLLFILTGFVATWKAAGSFAIGVITGCITSWICAYISVTGSVRSEAANEEGLEERSAQISFSIEWTIRLVAYSIGLFSLSICYLIFHDIQALLAHGLGALLFAFIVRICSTIFANGICGIGDTRLPICDPNDLPPPDLGRFPTQVQGHIEAAARNGAHTLAIYTTAIVTGGILASMQPFYINNPYVTCIFNHLHLDKACTTYTQTGMKSSMAAFVCRRDNLYTTYPTFTTWQSNTPLIGLCFLLGAIGILSTAISHLIACRISSAHRTKVATATSWVIGVAIAAASCYILLGPSSNMHATHKRLYPRYELSDTCDTMNDMHPSLTRHESEYEPLLPDGSSGSIGTQHASRAFVSVILGATLGVTGGAIRNWGGATPKTWHDASPGRLAAQMAGTCIAIVLTTGAAFRAHGWYGVALSAIGGSSVGGVGVLNVGSILVAISTFGILISSFSVPSVRALAGDAINGPTRDVASGLQTDVLRGAGGIGMTFGLVLACCVAGGALLAGGRVATGRGARGVGVVMGGGVLGVVVVVCVAAGRDGVTGLVVGCVAAGMGLGVVWDAGALLPAVVAVAAVVASEIVGSRIWIGIGVWAGVLFVGVAVLKGGAKRRGATGLCRANFKVNADVVSTFFEGGPTIQKVHMSPVSDLLHWIA